MMNNSNRNIEKEDLEVLLNFNLISFLASQETNKSKIDEFIGKFNNLVAMLFFETDLKNAPEEVRKEIEVAMEKEDTNEITKLMQEKFPDLKIRYLNNVLAAKKLIITDAITSQLMLLKADENVNETDHREKTIWLSKLFKVAEKDKWREFIKLLNQK